MSTTKGGATQPTQPSLNPGDTIILKEALPDGWWKVELNGTISRILIGRVKAIKRQKSSEEREKSLTRTASKKDASMNGLPPPLPAPLTTDSILHPRNQSHTTSSIPSPASSATTGPVSPRTTLDLRATSAARDEEILASPTGGTDEVLSEGEATTPPSREELLASKKRTNRREKSNTSSSSRGTTRGGSRQQVKTELLNIALDLEASHADLSLIVRVLETEAGVKLTALASGEEGRILQQLSREQLFLEKMLDGSYTPLFNADPKLKPGIALAPQRLLSLSELLVPPVNLGVLSSEEKILLQHLEFNVFPYKDTNNEHHVRLLLMAMFYEFDLQRTFQIPDATLYRFFTVVSRKYRQVPFHNFYHAFNVTQTMYFFLKTGGGHRVLGPLEIMACLIAAICHDCDHPGLNNDFQRKAQTRVYHMHKKSILENHHYLQCMSALANTETNIFANLTQEDEDQIYIYLRDLILATDLAVHGIILKSLTDRKKVLAKYVKAGSPVGMMDEDRKLIMVSLMKCADLSNEVRENNMSKNWAKLVMEEFFAQSSLERQLNLPVTPFMDKEKIIITKEQINFIEKLCLPLYTQLAQVFPEIETCCHQLESNRNSWQDRLRLFFSSPEELKKLSNKSIWEREQLKTKGANLSVSSTLSMLASNPGGMPTGARRSSKASIPSGAIHSPAAVGNSVSISIASSSNSGATGANAASSSGQSSSPSSSAPPPPLSTLVPSASVPDIRGKDTKDKEKDKEKDKNKDTKTKESARAVSAGASVPKTPKK